VASIICRQVEGGKLIRPGKGILGIAVVGIVFFSIIGVMAFSTSDERPLWGVLVLVAMFGIYGMLLAYYANQRIVLKSDHVTYTTWLRRTHVIPYSSITSYVTTDVKITIFADNRKYRIDFAGLNCVSCEKE